LIDHATEVLYLVSMKENNSKTQSQLYHVISSISELPDDGTFYDDCPLCQELKLQMQNGEVSREKSEVPYSIFRLPDLGES
jgi:hypothetical protein